jgi:uncharacterized protein (TIGR02466 family)
MSPNPSLRQLLQEGLQARQQGQWSTAQAAAEAVLKQSPEHPDALHLLGELARAQGQYAAAVGLFERSLHVNPQQALVWLRLGDAQEEQLRWSDAVSSYGRAALMQPALVQAHYNQARLLRSLGQLVEAEACLARALALPSVTPALRAQMLQLSALLHEDAGRLEPALLTLNEALAQAPERAALHHNQGVLLHRLARPTEALAAHDRALALGLDLADAHYNRGNSLQSLGRLPEALAAYRKALSRDPQHGLSLYDCARLRWRLGDADFAAELDAATLAAPDSGLAPGIKARLLLRARRYEAAAAAYAQAAARAPSVAGYFDGLGQALSRLGRTDEALAAHQRAVALAPEQAATHISHASSLLQAGNLEQSVAVAQTAVDLDPLDQQAWAFLGLAWRATGDARATWLNNHAQHVQVFDLPAPEGWADVDDFNRALAAALLPLHTDAQAPIDQTLNHGSQTLGNLFEQPNGVVDLLKRAIEQAVAVYLARLRALPADPSHPLLSRITPAWRFSDSWSSLLHSGGHHSHHVHSHGWLSSCYYVALPDAVNSSDAAAPTQAGWLTMGTPDVDVPGQILGPQQLVQPRVGRLVLFPSFMWHGTVPFVDALPRLTVAFDVLPQR